MLTYNLEKRGKLPIYDFLCRCIKADISAHKLKPNEKLPSKRQLAAHHKISVITVENAYNQLIDEGFVYSAEKKGYFVSPLIFPAYSAPKKAEKKFFENNPSASYLLNISSGKINAEKFPFSIWSRLMRQSLTDKYTELLNPVPPHGISELCEAISEYLYRFRGMEINSEQIIIGAGTEYLYTLLIQLLGKESVFAVENPGYKKVARIFSSCGASWVYTDLDENGISIEKLNISSASIVHTSPTHHYPTGIVMPAARRRELLNWAYSGENRYIIEDDYDSEFRFTGRPLPPLVSMDDGGKVIYINTFSKTIAPSLRISYMVLPYPLLEKYNSLLGFYSCTVPSFDQYTLYRFINDGYFEKHINRMKIYYKNLRDNIFKLIQESKLSEKITIEENSSGLHFLISLNTAHSDDEMKKKLLSCGIKANFLSDYSYGGKKNDSHTIVFNYSGINIESLKKAIDVVESKMLD